MARLEQLLARNLGCSRADARRLVIRQAITDHRGQVLADPRLEVDATETPVAIRLDDRAVALHDSAHVLLNKPVGCVTALTDPVHPVASSYLQNAPLATELRAVGRLDLDTSGLLLWTTDGGWLQRLTHPKRRVPRTYQAALARPFTPLTGTLVLHDGHIPQIDTLEIVDADRLHPSLDRPADCSRRSQRPMLAQNPPKFGVLNQGGSPSRTRTCDKSVNSRLLYQLSYRGSRWRRRYTQRSSGAQAQKCSDRKAPTESEKELCRSCAQNVLRRGCLPENGLDALIAWLVGG